MIDQPPPLPLDRAGLLALRERWTAAWPAALDAWSRFHPVAPARRFA